MRFPFLKAYICSEILKYLKMARRCIMSHDAQLLHYASQHFYVPDEKAIANWHKMDMKAFWKHFGIC